VTWQKKGPQVSHHRTGKGNHCPILVEGRPASNRKNGAPPTAIPGRPTSARCPTRYPQGMICIHQTGTTA
jgi:hypothetical protein